MADFAANLISVPPVEATSANGGNTAAAVLTTIPSFLTGAAFAGAQDAIFIGVKPLIRGEVVGGFSPAQILTLGAVLPQRAINRVYDSVAARAVTWVTVGEDPAGAFYPGPGVYGVNTSFYVLIGYISTE